MISQTLRNLAVGSTTKIADLGAYVDGSMKLRLQQMRCYKDADVMYCEPVEIEVDVDNCIASQMYAIYNFARLRHADKIGVTYWMISGEDGQTLVPVDFFTMLDGKVHSIRHSNAILNGDLEFPSNTWESDMECLVTFVEHSSKSKIVGQYRTLQSKMDASRNIEPARSLESFEPTGSHRAVDAMQGVYDQIASLPDNDAFNPNLQIEPFVESIPASGKVRKNRQKRIAQDCEDGDVIDTSASKTRRKSDKTVVDVAYTKNDGTDSKTLMPVKAKSRTSRKASSMPSI